MDQVDKPLTARAGGGRVSWDMWRQIQKTKEGAKCVKAATTTAAKYVKKHDLQDFVVRTTSAGYFVVIDLQTGEEVKVQLTKTGNIYKHVWADKPIEIRTCVVLGVDRLMQLRLMEKFTGADYWQPSWTVDQLRYCADNPEFTELLLSDYVPKDLFMFHPCRLYRLTFEMVANNPQLARPHPTQSDPSTLNLLYTTRDVSEWCEQYISRQLKGRIDYELNQFRPDHPMDRFMSRLGYYFRLREEIYVFKTLTGLGYVTLDELKLRFASDQ